MKIWAKVIRDNKIVKDYIFKTDKPFEIQDFFDYMNDICYNLNLGTPIIVAKHISNFIMFRSVRFMPDNFIESCNFDYLQLVNITE